MSKKTILTNSAIMPKVPALAELYRSISGIISSTITNNIEPVAIVNSLGSEDWSKLTMLEPIKPPTGSSKPVNN